MPILQRRKLKLQEGKGLSQDEGLVTGQFKPRRASLFLPPHSAVREGSSMVFQEKVLFLPSCVLHFAFHISFPMTAPDCFLSPAPYQPVWALGLGVPGHGPSQ